MKLKTIELTGHALDWAVEDCEYARMQSEGEYVKGWVLDYHKSGVAPTRYSTDWAHGGPIIEREKMGVFPTHGGWAAGLQSGPTPLIAAMRCYVASRLGEDVSIPEELQ